MKKTVDDLKGFTLIELLLVIAVIVALAVTVFVALNPALRLAQARDARRTADVDALLTATHEYILDNSGTLPTGISTSTDTMIGTCAAGTALANTGGGCDVASGTNCFDASTTYASYLKGAPIDPSGGTASDTGYAITVQASTSIVTVKACNAEKLSQIWSSR